MCAHVGGSQEGIRSPGVGVTGSRELPNMGAGTWTWVLCKNSIHWALSPAQSRASPLLFSVLFSFFPLSSFLSLPSLFLSKERRQVYWVYCKGQWQEYFLKPQIKLFQDTHLTMSEFFSPYFALFIFYFFETGYLISQAGLHLSV